MLKTEPNNRFCFIVVVVLSPEGEEPSQLTQEDVWGKWVDGEKVSKGMIVARYNEKCPYFNDIIPYKSVTVVCKESQYSEVEYWLDYVQGCGSIVSGKPIDDELIAIPWVYHAW